MTKATHVFAAIGAVVLLASAAARAQDEKPEPSAYARALTDGHKAMLAQNYEDAIRNYEEAKNAESGNPESYYFLACGRMAKGDYDAAVSDFRTAINVAGEKRPDLVAKSLFCLGMIEEARKTWDAAKTAWNTYLSYANTHQNAPIFVENAKQRIKAIEDREAREIAAAPVRQRIADREAKKGGGGTKKIVGY